MLFAAAATQPASAITFPSLTTIYVGSGVTDSGNGPNAGYATSFHCTNVSGQTANVRFLVLGINGNAVGSFTQTLLHGESVTASTHLTTVFVDADINAGVAIKQGGVNIEATQSGVFCTAMIVDASVDLPNGIDLHLVRVNPHPGTVE